MKTSTTLSSLLLAALLGGCSVPLPFLGGTPNNAPMAATEGTTELEPVPAGTVRVLLMRAQNDQGGVLNVFHGQRFHASLQPGEFTALNMCPNDVGYFVTSLESPAQVTEANVARLIEMRERLSPGQQRVYRVALQDQGAVSIQPIVQSAVDLSRMTEQRRLLSRVQLNCGASPVESVTSAQAAPVAAPVVPRAQPVAPAAPAPAPSARTDGTVTIPSDLAFPFASYSLSASGRTQIRQRVEQFLAESGIRNIEAVVVRGHSDPVGKPHRKELVSGERAKAVALHLSRELGIPVDKIRAEAMSDRALVVSDCPNSPVARRDACNAPNRRVEIVIQGSR